MGRWLSRVQASSNDIANTSPQVKSQKSVGQYPPQTPKSTLRGLGGMAQGAFSENNALSPPQQKSIELATSAEIADIIGGLKATGRSLGLVEALARDAMTQLTREAAAELAVVLDDAFVVAPDNATARAYCRRLLNDPQALEAAKAVWPNLPPALVPVTQSAPSAPVVDHAPQWLRLIRENCPLVPEDEKLLTRCLAMQPLREALEAAKQYVITWKHAASIEPREAARDNAGRRAANNKLRGGSRHAR
ncbi:hypothetical protein NYA30BAC_00323 [Halomonas sp. NYA30]